MDRPPKRLECEGCDERTLTYDNLATAFRAYLQSVVESPGDVADGLAVFELPAGLAEQVVELLEKTPVPSEVRR
jgi:hypothetical protein